jgi:tRNA (cytidine/uridine-2'-O-)-methyltransferase
MHIVLVDPQIPQNTGSIARTCAATKTPLHIVGNPAFEISDRTVKRAGLDYWPWVELSQHSSWEEFEKKIQPPQIWLLSKFGERVYTNAQFAVNDALVFGSETKGLGKEFIGQFPSAQVLRIPIDCEHVRSLNLSNAVSIVLYEARRQLGL